MNKAIITESDKQTINRLIPFDSVSQLNRKLPYNIDSIVELVNGDMVRITSLMSLIKDNYNYPTGEIIEFFIEGVICSYSNTAGDFIYSNFKIVFDTNAIKYIITK